MKAWMGSFSLAASLLVPRLAVAQAVDNIGNAGQIVFGAERLMGLSYSRRSSTIERSDIKFEMEDEEISLGLGGWDAPTIFERPRLAMDYFIIDGLSLGAAFIYSRVSGENEQDAIQSDQTQHTSVETGPTHHLLLHPRAGYSFIVDETSRSGHAPASPGCESGARRTTTSSSLESVPP